MDNKVQVTLKSGAGFDAPWVSIGGDTEAETAFNLRAVLGPDYQGSADFFALVAEAATRLKGFYTASDTLGAVQVAQASIAPAVQHYQQAAAQPAPSFQPAQPQYAPQDQQPQWQQHTAPAGPPAPQCAHGNMTHRKGNGAKGEWQAFMCPTPKGTPNQCAPQWLKRGEAGWQA